MTYNIDNDYIIDDYIISSTNYKNYQSLYLFNNIYKLTIPKCINYIENNLYKNNEFLTIIYYYGNADISENCFENCINLKSFVSNNANYKIICKNAFKNCINIEKIILSDNIEIIDSWAFENCINLKSVILPKSIKYINDYVFYNSGINFIIINNDKINIEQNAFKNCNNLKYINLSLNIYNKYNYIFENYKICNDSYVKKMFNKNITLVKL